MSATYWASLFLFAARVNPHSTSTTGFQVPRSGIVPKPRPTNSGTNSPVEAQPRIINEPLFASAAERPYLDPFKFTNYPDEVALFRKYYRHPIERLVRYFVYIYNVYHVLSVKQAKHEVARIKSSPDVRQALDDFTDTIILQEFIYEFYKHYNPEKANRKNIDALIVKYQFTIYQSNTGDFTNVLINRLYELYIYNPLANRQEWLESELIDRPFQPEILWFGDEFDVRSS
jgi:hypothetical protein